MAKFHYIVDLDERGLYYAHVTDAKTEQKVIFEVSNEITDFDEDGNEYTYNGGFSMVEDGFMKHNEDMTGLFWYLVKMGILKESDDLIFRG